jgi:hypothetical protein
MGNILKIKWLRVLLVLAGSLLPPCAQAADQHRDILDDATGLDAGNGAWNASSAGSCNSSDSAAKSLLSAGTGDDNTFFQTGEATLSGALSFNF